MIKSRKYIAFKKISGGSIFDPGSFRKFGLEKLKCLWNGNILSSYGNLMLEQRYFSTELKSDQEVKRWHKLCNKLLEDINKYGIQSLEDKFIPVKSKKYRADGSVSDYFIDYCTTKVVGGNGGDGCATLAQLFRNEKAGPDGGDGGNGGHILIKSTRNKKSLNHFPKFIMAKSGENGMSKSCNGKSAEDIVIEVPVGTIFKLNDTVVADLEEGDIFVAARGGAGGKGNSFFATSLDQTPKFAEYGGRGEVFTYKVELKVMADIGLIGFPNAGKSTLLRSISRARPKVASYPFTTLNPHVGMVSFQDYHQVAVADIPGLIEGSHANLGLGMAFLKHIQRCSCLLYVLDGSEENSPWQLEILKKELEQYEEGLSKRPHAIVLNKMDLAVAKKSLHQIQKATDLPVIPISAKTNQNVVPLQAVMRLLTEYHNS